MAVRVGFIGVGGIAGGHIQVLSKMQGVSLVAFCDVVQERAQAAAQAHGGKAYRDHHEMFKEQKLDALYVCTPPFAHSDAEVIAAKKGVHLFVEKPIALTLEKALEIRDAVAKAGIATSVGYHFRYFDTTAMARKLVRRHKLGMVLGYWMGGMPGVAWWRVMKESGGQFHEQTTHIFDLARYFAGEVKTVFAAAGTRALQDVPKFDIYDVGTATLEFRNGVVGTINNTCILGGGARGVVGLHAICQDLVVEVGGGMLQIREGNREETIRAAVDCRIAQNDAFIKAVRDGDRSGILSDYADGVKSLALSVAANQSIATGEPVKVKV
jgi:myo-inositol 2-dehydrogenase/D-chiro-inositol 1-dehydrogenase